MKTIISIILLLVIALSANTSSKDICSKTNQKFNLDGFSCANVGVLKLYFPSDSYVITKRLHKHIKVFAKFLKDNLEYSVDIYGHTDNKEDYKYNLTLSQNRAKSVKKAICSYGIDASRLYTQGKSFTEPAATNENKEGRAYNRRIEVILLK
ncbi:MAG: OmpA family protein [Sulfurimonas sp.]|nr:OmpA family protein [Sulfurimonas sp.]